MDFTFDAKQKDKFVYMAKMNSKVSMHQIKQEEDRMLPYVFETLYRNKTPCEAKDYMLSFGREKKQGLFKKVPDVLVIFTTSAMYVFSDMEQTTLRYEILKSVTPKTSTKIECVNTSGEKFSPFVSNYGNWIGELLSIVVDIKNESLGIEPEPEKKIEKTPAKTTKPTSKPAKTSTPKAPAPKPEPQEERRTMSLAEFAELMDDIFDDIPEEDVKTESEKELELPVLPNFLDLYAKNFKDDEDSFAKRGKECLDQGMQEEALRMFGEGITQKKDVCSLLGFAYILCEGDVKFRNEKNGIDMVKTAFKVGAHGAGYLNAKYFVKQEYGKELAEFIAECIDKEDYWNLTRVYLRGLVEAFGVGNLFEYLDKCLFPESGEPKVTLEEIIKNEKEIYHKYLLWCIHYLHGIGRMNMLQKEHYFRMLYPKYDEYNISDISRVVFKETYYIGTLDGKFYFVVATGHGGFIKVTIDPVVVACKLTDEDVSKYFTPSLGKRFYMCVFVDGNKFTPYFVTDFERIK